MLELFTRRQRVAAAFHTAWITVCCAVVPMPAYAAQTQALVEVKVLLRESGVVLREGLGGSRGSPSLCRNTSVAGAFGASVTVVCSTGAVVDIAPGQLAAIGRPMHGGAYRFITQAIWNGDSLDSLDDAAGMGTITTWRVVKLADRNYLEMTIGW